MLLNKNPGVLSSSLADDLLLFLNATSADELRALFTKTKHLQSFKRIFSIYTNPNIKFIETKGLEYKKNMGPGYTSFEKCLARIQDFMVESSAIFGGVEKQTRKLIILLESLNSRDADVYLAIVRGQFKNENLSNDMSQEFFDINIRNRKTNSRRNTQ